MVGGSSDGVSESMKQRLRFASSADVPNALPELAGAPSEFFAARSTAGGPAVWSRAVVLDAETVGVTYLEVARNGVVLREEHQRWRLVGDEARVVEQSGQASVSPAAGASPTVTCGPGYQPCTRCVSVRVVDAAICCNRCGPLSRWIIAYLACLLVNCPLCLSEHCTR